jgi:cyclopropane fatty-acyl-phospholipid synthase-like methyltransferase
MGVSGVSKIWEDYYVGLSRLPKRLGKPVPFITETLPMFKSRKIQRLLDLGCGAGRHCIYFAKKNFNVIGIDFSISALKIAKAWAHREKLKNVAFIRGSMTNLPFINCCFDAVISVSVIHHAIKSQITKTIDEIHKILRKDGLFLTNLVSVRNHRYGKGEKLENRTFRVEENFEEKRFQELHHFFTRKEASNLLAKFTKVNIQQLTAGKRPHHYWKITAIK